MDLHWTEAWTDIVANAAEILNLCETNLSKIPLDQRSRSSEVLATAKQQLANQPDKIRHQPHIWGTQLANVAIRIVRYTSSRVQKERDLTKVLANFCGIVYNFRRRRSTSGDYENLFRNSIEAYISASLPDIVTHVLAVDLLENIREWLKRFYDALPRDLCLRIHDLVLEAYEFRRGELDRPDTHGNMVTFLESNCDLISLAVSEPLEGVRRKWEDLYRTHVGTPPATDTIVITEEVRNSLKQALRTNDPLAVRDVLAPLETTLSQRLRKRLDSSLMFREPHHKIRDLSRNPSADFQAARRQLANKSIEAISAFYEIWRDQPQNLFAQEWYAYALATIQDSPRQARELFDQVRKAGKGDQITDWNVACCEIKLKDLPGAFAILKERVESGRNCEEALDPALDLAFQLGDTKFLAKQLDWLPIEEAVLLGYLYAADTGAPSDVLEQRLNAVEIIASDSRSFEPPLPEEALDINNLGDLSFEFIRRWLVRGGITWFRRRVACQRHKFFYLNWKYLADMCLRERLFCDAEAAYDMMLQHTNRHTVPAEVKQRALDSVLTALVEHERALAAGTILQKFQPMLSGTEADEWRQRIAALSAKLQLADSSPGASKMVSAIADTQPRDLEHSTIVGSTARGQETTHEDSRSRLMTLMAHLHKIRRLEDLGGNFDDLKEITECLHNIWPAYSRKVVHGLKDTIETLQRFCCLADAGSRETVGIELRARIGELNATVKDVLDPSLKSQAESIAIVLSRLAADASFQTGAARKVEIDSRVMDYLPAETLPRIAPNAPETAVVLRIINRGAEQVLDVKVHLEGESGHVTVEDSPQKLGDPLNPNESAIVRFPISYSKLEGTESFLAYVNFGAGGVTNLQSSAIRFTLPMKRFTDLIGADVLRDRFFVGFGIPEDRRDIFYGREREHERIANSVRGQVQAEVLFLNGPRRVGKTSILNSLKWALREHDASEVIPVGVPEDIPQTTGAYLWGIAAEIGKSVGRHFGVDGYVHVPTPEEFGGEPTLAFRTFCARAQHRIAPRRLLLMIDETQRLADAIKHGRIDSNVLGLFSTLMSSDTGVMFVFTASVLFRDVKNLSAHPLWGRLVPFNTGFLNADAIQKVMAAGVAGYPVTFTAESLCRIWTLTEGHPFLVQAIGKRLVAEVLNPQRRLTVCPADVDQAIKYIEKNEDQYTYYWWNDKPEEGGFIDETDWHIASVIVGNQKKPGCGVAKAFLLDQMQRQGRPISNERLRKLTDMQTVVQEIRDSQEFVRIKGLFFERWLADQIAARQTAFTPTAQSSVALFVDHENVAISTRKFVEQLPTDQQVRWEPLKDINLLARRLHQNAERYGTLATKVVVANWPLFVGDLSAYANAMFTFDQPLGGKNTSDEKLKQAIRDTLEKDPTVATYVVATGDGDFRDTIQTLLKRNKRVVLWGFRGIGTVRSNISSTFRQLESWQNITIEYLDDILLRESAPSAKAAQMA